MEEQFIKILLEEKEKQKETQIELEGQKVTQENFKIEILVFEEWTEQICTLFIKEILEYAPKNKIQINKIRQLLVQNNEVNYTEEELQNHIEENSKIEYEISQNPFKILTQWLNESKKQYNIKVLQRYFGIENYQEYANEYDLLLQKKYLYIQQQQKQEDLQELKQKQELAKEEIIKNQNEAQQKQLSEQEQDQFNQKQKQLETQIQQNEEQINLILEEQNSENLIEQKYGEYLLQVQPNNNIISEDWYIMYFRANDQQLEFSNQMYELQQLQKVQNLLYQQFCFNKDLFYFAQINSIKVIKFDKFKVKIQNDQFYDDDTVCETNTHKKQEIYYYAIEVSYSYKSNDLLKQMKDMNVPSIQEIKKSYKDYQDSKKEREKEKQKKINKNYKEVELPDGIYFLAQIIKVKDLYEKLLETLNQNITFCHISYYLLSVIQKIYEHGERIIQNNNSGNTNSNNDNTNSNIFLVDIDINCLLIVKEGHSLKFIYYPKFTQFCAHIKNQYAQLQQNNQQQEFKFMKQKESYFENQWLQKKISVMLYLFGQSIIDNNDFKKKADGLEQCDRDMINKISPSLKIPSLEEYLQNDSYKKKRTQQTNLEESLLIKLLSNPTKYQERAQKLKQLFEEENKIVHGQVTQSRQKVHILQEFFNIVKNTSISSGNQKEGIQGSGFDFQEIKISDNQEELSVKGTISNNKAQRTQKNFKIDYFEAKNALLLKISYSDMILNIETSDEVNLSTQLICSKENRIQIDIDEHRRVTARTTICLGYSTLILQALIEAFDVCMTCIVCYYDYYYFNVLGNKSSRDAHKFYQLYDEMNYLLQKHEFDNQNFFDKINNSK